MSIKKGQLYTGKVTEYKYPDQGKVVVEEETVWIKGALPQERVSFYISRKRSGSCKGRLNEVLNRAPYEDEESDCPYFGQCGGCSYRNISYEKQLEIKKDIVRSLLTKAWKEAGQLTADDLCVDNFEFAGIYASPERYGYRNKMEFSFGDEYKGGPLALGLHRKGSFHDILNMRSCCIVHPDFDVIRNAVRDFFAKYYETGQIDFLHKNSHEGYLRHLLLRRSAATGDILAALVTASAQHEEDEMISDFTEMLRNLKLEGRIAGAFHIYNDSLSDVVKSDRTDLLFGRDRITEEILGLKFEISLFSFFQTNSKGAEVLYSIAREMSGMDGRHTGVIYDLYCGTGTITQLMSPAADKVIGIEIVEEAVRAAAINAALNGIDNTEFIVGDVMKILCGEAGESLPRPDYIILDPPREGIHPKALQKILSFGVDNIIYISCKASSLAEELTAFRKSGYQLQKAAVVDLFPDTVHVETVVLMSRVKD